MLDFQIPRITAETVEDNRGSFTVEPLDRGFGYTFGNSLRRVLLSSLAGAAVTSVRIEGVAHEFSTINGRRVDIPSYQVRESDVIAIKADTGATQVIRDATELVAQVPAWLQADHDGLTAKVLRRPERDEIAVPVQEQLIVELYSK